MGDRIEGGVKKGVDRVQDAIGELTGHGRTRERGKINEAAGSLQDTFGQVRDQAEEVFEEVESYVEEQPALALAAALAIGLLAGLALRGGAKTVDAGR